MNWELSEFGQNLANGSGIGELMEDLGHALAENARQQAAAGVGGEDTTAPLRMLGGGQPAHLDAITRRWRTGIETILSTAGSLERVLGNYEPPGGNRRFRQAIADLFSQQFGWSIGPQNVAVTMGGQTAFFLLFNSLAGRFADGRHKRVLLPLLPEYIGYANQSVGGDLFRCLKPKIERIGPHQFKYHVDFDALQIDQDIAAICVSRPTNPTGNVLTDDEVDQLAALAQQHGIPLIIDNAYGAPFPNVIFNQVRPIWNENTILTLSLSKLGLPGTRTGIVIAPPEVVQQLESMTSIVGLANPNIGQAIATPLIESGEVLKISNDVIRPYYRQRSEQAQQWVDEFFDASLPWRTHVSEGAFFLWLWLEDCPVSAKELYQRLKQRSVFVVPGHYFFFGLDDDAWRHRYECMRISFAPQEQDVREGLRIIADEVSKAYRGGE